MKDILGGAQRLAGLPLSAPDPSGDFQARFNLRNFGWADAFNGRKLAGGSVFEPFEAAEIVQQPAGGVEGAFAGAGVAIAQNDREELGFAEHLRALGKKLFP